MLNIDVIVSKFFGLLGVSNAMPPKIRELILKLEKAGFVNRGGKGSHRNFVHPNGQRITISGKPSDDAKIYQEREVLNEIEESTK